LPALLHAVTFLVGEVEDKSFSDLMGFFGIDFFIEKFIGAFKASIIYHQALKQLDTTKSKNEFELFRTASIEQKVFSDKLITMNAGSSIHLNLNLNLGAKTEVGLLISRPLNELTHSFFKKDSFYLVNKNIENANKRLAKFNLTYKFNQKAQISLNFHLNDAFKYDGYSLKFNLKTNKVPNGYKLREGSMYKKLYSKIDANRFYTLHYFKTKIVNALENKSTFKVKTNKLGPYVDCNQAIDVFDSSDTKLVVYKQNLEPKPFDFKQANNKILPKTFENANNSLSHNYPISSSLLRTFFHEYRYNEYDNYNFIDSLSKLLKQLQLIVHPDRTQRALKNQPDKHFLQISSTHIFALNVSKRLTAIKTLLFDAGKDSGSTVATAMKKYFTTQEVFNFFTGKVRIKEIRSVLIAKLLCTKDSSDKEFNVNLTNFLNENGDSIILRDTSFEFIQRHFIELPCSIKHSPLSSARTSQKLVIGIEDGQLTFSILNEFIEKGIKTKYMTPINIAHKLINGVPKYGIDAIDNLVTLHDEFKTKSSGNYDNQRQFLEYQAFLMQNEVSLVVASEKDNIYELVANETNTSPKNIDIIRLQNAFMFGDDVFIMGKWQSANSKFLPIDQDSVVFTERSYKES
jgi:hypothetical protein